MLESGFGMDFDDIIILALMLSPAMWLMVLWSTWISFLSSVDLWGWYVLVLLILGTLALPVYMIFFGSKHMATMARLTPEYERPKGH